MTHKILNASNVFGTIGFLAMIAATGAGENLPLGLLFTAIFGVCMHLAVKEDGKKR